MWHSGCIRAVVGSLRWGDQWYSFPILGPDININPQEAEAFTQVGKNQTQMLPAARRTMFGRNGRYSNDYAVFTFTYLIKPTLRRISVQCRTSSSTILDEMYQCSFPASSFHGVFGDLYILPPSQPSLLISLKQRCFRWWIAQFQWRACFPQWAVRCKSFSESNIIMWWERRGERLFWAKLNVSNWKHREVGNI